MQSKHGDPKQNCFKNIYLVRLRVNFIDLGDKLIDVNESDPRSNVHYSGSSENKAWKKFRLVRYFFQALFSLLPE